MHFPRTICAFLCSGFSCVRIARRCQQTETRETAVSVVLNAAGNFVAMVVPLLVRPHELSDAGAGPLLILDKPGRSMCGSSALSAKLLCSSSLRLVYIPKPGSPTSSLQSLVLLSTLYLRKPGSPSFSLQSLLLRVLSTSRNRVLILQASACSHYYSLLPETWLSNSTHYLITLHWYVALVNLLV